MVYGRLPARYLLYNVVLPATLDHSVLNCRKPCLIAVYLTQTGTQMVVLPSQSTAASTSVILGKT